MRHVPTLGLMTFVLTSMVLLPVRGWWRGAGGEPGLSPATCSTVRSASHAGPLYAGATDGRGRGSGGCCSVSP